MRILLLGANGQVGHELLRTLAPLGEVLPATREGRLVDGGACLAADLADADSLARAMEAADARLIVNAAAYTSVDRAEEEPQLADRVNRQAVAEIGAFARASGAHVVHYSTDYVFDGSGVRPYREDDPTAPLGAYGRSKLGGEDALRESGARHWIFRTAWVYAARGHNFLLTMLRLGAERDVLRVVADQIGAPTPAGWIAAATATALARGETVGSGTWHCTAAGQCSWHEFAGAIMDGAVRRGVLARAPEVRPITSAGYPTPARRPAWSVLDCGRLEAAFGIQSTGWREGLDDVLDAIAGMRRADP